jgi:hypothetical protein
MDAFWAHLTSWRDGISPFKQFKLFHSPTSLRRDSGHAFLPRVAGDEGGGLIDLNALNGLNFEHKREAETAGFGLDLRRDAS